jgi:hypothetical protein
VHACVCVCVCAGSVTSSCNLLNCQKCPRTGESVLERERKRDREDAREERASERLRMSVTENECESL